MELEILMIYHGLTSRTFRIQNTIIERVVFVKLLSLQLLQFSITYNPQMVNVDFVDDRLLRDVIVVTELEY